MTRLPVPEYATATNILSSLDQHTERQLLSAADVRAVQVIPSGLVITRLPVPEYATATNILSSLDQHTEYQLLSAADVRAVHVLTHSAALAPLVLVRLFSAVMFTPLTSPSELGSTTLLP
jgi:predicted DNA-binding protein